MPRLTIDGREVCVEPGATILDAAGKAGIRIPTLCFLHGHPPFASCMVCAVRVNGREVFLPACATRVADGMVVESETEEVRAARRTALELLLGEHLGDCVGPCESACPAGMNIPQMIRQIGRGRFHDAIATVRRHIALPGVLGRICPAPCEKACRRGVKDQPVSICLLKRFAADVDLGSAEPYRPSCKEPTGKEVAVVGAGPAGLAGAYYLLQRGHKCTVFDDHDEPGGMLRYGVSAELLPRDVLDREIGLIEGLGARFQLNTRLGVNLSVADLQKRFDALLIAIGQVDPEEARTFGLEVTAKGIRADRRTLATSLPGVFAAGGAIAPTKMAVRAVADGRAAAVSVEQYLSGKEVSGERTPFTVHIGKLGDGEVEQFAAGAGGWDRVEPSGGAQVGFTPEEARREAARCLHCDCRGRDKCKLRGCAEEYGARTRKYKGERKAFEQEARHPEVIYEPGKCIDCGICVRITDAAGESLGLTFVGSGFNLRVAVPFGDSLAEGLEKVARECVDACPTGALAFKDARTMDHSSGERASE